MLDKRISVVCLAIFFSTIHAAHAYSTDWAVHIRVSVPDSRGVDGTVWNHLIAGVHEGATDGFDSSRDTLSMVEVDDPVQSIFAHGIIPEDKNNDGVIDDWTCSRVEAGYTDYACSLWRDFRAFGAEKVWSFIILSHSNDFFNANGVTVTLQWAFENKPENMEIVLIDLSNSIEGIDMLNSSLYSYTNTFEAGKKYGIHYFEIRVKVKGLFINLPDLSDATISTPYNVRLSAIGGTPVWSLVDGDLPPGMSVNPYTGEVAGTPASTGSYTFTIRVDDPINGYSSSKEYTLNINSIPRIDVSTLPDGRAGTAYSGRIGVTGGSAPFAWSIKGNLPEGVTLDSKTGIISGSLIVPGIYDLTATIKDANGATDSKDFRITVIEPDDEKPPGAIFDLRGVYATDTSVLLIWSAPTDDGMTHTAALYDLRYMECPFDEGGWDNAIEAAGEPRPQAGALQTYSLTGIRSDKTYCIAIKSMDASMNVSAISNIVKVSLSSGMGVSGLSGLTASLRLRKGYNLISLPFIPVPNVRDSLFGPILGNPVALYRWYSAYHGITPPQYYLEDILVPGLGYFLYSPADVSLDINGLKLTDEKHSVLLQHGWNMIGTPYYEPILLQDILVKKSATGEVKLYIEAVKADWIGNTIYHLKGGNYDFASFNDDPPAALEPWGGYWIYVNDGDGVEIIFRRQ